MAGCSRSTSTISSTPPKETSLTRSLLLSEARHAKIAQQLSTMTTEAWCARIAAKSTSTPPRLAKVACVQALPVTTLLMATSACSSTSTSSGCASRTSSRRRTTPKEVALTPASRLLLPSFHNRASMQMSEEVPMAACSVRPMPSRASLEVFPRRLRKEAHAHSCTSAASLCVTNAFSTSSTPPSEQALARTAASWQAKSCKAPKPDTCTSAARG
mmetsp:Transcript_120909/g.353248  ORF Transcript_120909/g.353248 Transcript_120909/m.353248 type:complete len:215 (-) Transcript_120909:1499-2143(-)